MYANLAKLHSWEGTAESFILSWQDQMHLCESLVNAYRHLPDNLKKTLLENEVASNSHLRVVKDNAD